MCGTSENSRSHVRLNKSNQPKAPKLIMSNKGDLGRIDVRTMSVPLNFKVVKMISLKSDHLSFLEI